MTYCFEISRAETEAKELRRETLLLGEIVRKFRENASLAPQIVANENEKHLTNTYRNQVIALFNVFLGLLIALTLIQNQFHGQIFDIRGHKQFSNL